MLAAGVNPNATNRYSTPLTSAAYQDNKDLVALLLARPGINVDAQEVDGYTALMWVAERGSLDVVTLLLNADANPNIKNSHGQRAVSLGTKARDAAINSFQTGIQTTNE